MTTPEKIQAIKEIIAESKSNSMTTANKKIQRLIDSIPDQEYLLYKEKLTKIIPHEKSTKTKR